MVVDLGLVPHGGAQITERVQGRAREDRVVRVDFSVVGIVALDL